MQQTAPPHIQVPPAIGKAFKEHLGEPCVVLLMVKYAPEETWVQERLWMLPGWEQPDLWKAAYRFLHNEARLMYYTVSEIEAVRFYSLKLV